jgi:hypothetical protein
LDDREREKPHNPFTHRLIESAMIIDDISPEEFWHSVAYQEYIQDWLPCPGVSPDEGRRNLSFAVW